MSDTNRYNEMFDYLRDPEMPTEAHGNFVFGRADPLVARKLGELYIADLVDYALITGGIGKDSGQLAEQGIAEAEYLGGLAQEKGIPERKLHLETKASNGGENARFGLAMIEDRGLPHERLTAVAHATSVRRLAETLKHESGKANVGVSRLYRVPTDYPFDPTNPADQDEARAELLRLADWPDKGWLGPQADLPEDLVDFARDRQPK